MDKRKFNFISAIYGKYSERVVFCSCMFPQRNSNLLLLFCTPSGFSFFLVGRVEWGEERVERVERGERGEFKLSAKTPSSYSRAEGAALVYSSDSVLLSFVFQQDTNSTKT